jgi:hypothetical protein
MKESEREKDRTHNERFGAMAGVPRWIVLQNSKCRGPDLVSIYS